MNNRTTIMIALLAVVMMIGTASAAPYDDTINVTIDGTAAQDLVAGMTCQDLGAIRVVDSATTSGDYVLAVKTTLTLPEGITLNATASPQGEVCVIALPPAGSFDVVTWYYEDDDKFVVTHTKTSDNGDGFEITGLVVDVASDADASGAGTINEVDVKCRVGTIATELLDVYKPEVTQVASTAAAGKSGETLSDLVIITNTADGQIGNNTNIVIYAPTESGITFDESQTITVTGDAVVNATAATVTSGSITLPVTEDWVATNTATITGIKVNTTADASDDALTVNVTAAGTSTGVVAADVDAVEDIEIQKPTVDLAAAIDLAVGMNEQAIGAVTVTSFTNGDIGDGTNVTIKLNNTGVTFDLTSSPLANGLGLTNAAVEVSANELTVKITDGTAGPLVFANIQVNVSCGAADDTPVMVHAETQSSDAAPVVTSDAANLITLQKPTITFAENTINMDKDGEVSKLLTGITVTSTVDGDMADGTNVTIKLASASGVTFDLTSSPTATGAGIAAGDVAVSANELTVEITGDSAVGNTVAFIDIQVNATTSAVNVTPEIETNTTDCVVTTDAPNKIVINAITADTITYLSGDLMRGVGEETTFVWTVTNATALADFGGQKVNFETNATGALNRSSGTTAADGTVAVEFKAPSTIGVYNVIATIDGTTINDTEDIDVTAGDAYRLAIIPDVAKSAPNGVATITIVAQDASGNNATSTETVRLVVTSSDAYITEVVNPKPLVAGVATFTMKKPTSGIAPLMVTDETDALIYATGEQVFSEDIGSIVMTSSADSLSADGKVANLTVQLYDLSGDVIALAGHAITIESSNATHLATVGTSPVTTDTSGIAVSNLTSNLNNVTGTVWANASITNQTGVKLWSNVTVAVTEHVPPTMTVTATPASITVSEETVITVNVTEDDGTPIEGASVALEFSGAATAPESTNTTEADGTCTVTVNVTEAGTINVTATKADYTGGSATVTVGEVVLANMTVTATPDSINVSEDTVITINVTDTSTGAPIADGASVTLEFNGTEIGSCTTTDGECTATVNETAGAINVTVTASGYNDGSATVTVGAAAGLTGDINGDGKVDMDELFVGIDAYMAGTADMDYLFGAIDAYMATA